MLRSWVNSRIEYSRPRFAHAARVSFLTLLILALLPACSGCMFLCEVLGIGAACGMQPQRPIDLKALQDLQVAVEVRFIGVTDDFFERIGVDFDFDINGEAGLVALEPVAAVAPVNPLGRAYLTQAGLVGGQLNCPILVPKQTDGFTRFLTLLPQGNTTAITNFAGLPLIRSLPATGVSERTDLDAIPGGATLTTRYNPEAAALGFAVLSDIEANLFLQAVQAEATNRLLDGPKLRCFHEQPGIALARNELTTINDVEPDFADAAKAVDPLVGIMTSGPNFQVVPVISADRRSVRLDIRPLITAIAEFPGGQIDGVNQFVQFPIVQPAGVQTSILVDDGGTILLGGYKKIAGGTMERGVPILNKIPFVNRLFKNAAVIKDEQHLLIMVTPRIVIAEEE